MTRAGASLVRLGLTEPWAEDTLTQLGWWAGDRPAEGAEQIMWALARSPEPSLALRGAERLVAALTDRAGVRRRAPRGGGPAGAAARLAGELDRARRPPRRCTPTAGTGCATTTTAARAGDELASALLAAVGAEPDAPPAGSPGGGSRDGDRFGGRRGPAHRVPRRAAGARRRRPRRRLRARPAGAGRGGGRRAAVGHRGRGAAGRAGRRGRRGRRRPGRATRAGSRSSRWASAAAAS